MASNLSMFGGIGASIAKHSIGFFPDTTSGRVADATAVGLTEDGEAELTVYISGNVCIKGALNNLNNEDLLKLKENYATENGYRNDIFLDGTIPPCETHLTFFPKTVVMDVTPALAKTLDLLEKANAPAVDSLSPSDELRSLTLNAICSQSKKRALSENLMLKAQHEALRKVKEQIMRVDIGHRDGIVSFSLDEGEWMTGSNGDLHWIIRLEGKEHSSMVVHSIGDSTFSVSGSTLNIKELQEYQQIRRGFIGGTEGNPFFCLIIPYYDGIEVIGAINWYEQSDDDLPEILDSYHEKVRASMRSTVVTRNEFGNVHKPFPDTFRLELLYVSFRSHLIKDIFNVVGCDDLLVTEGSEEPTD